MDQRYAFINPIPPFDFELTASHNTDFRNAYRINSKGHATYRRLIDLRDKLVLASVCSEGTVEVPRLALELQGEGLTQEDVEGAVRRVAWLLGTDQNLTSFYSMTENDSVMSEVVRCFYGLHLTHTETVFEALVLAVLGQQIATNVARMIRTLIIETFGPLAEFDGETYYAFPRPETIWSSSPEVLRTMKLTQHKSEYVHGIAGLALDPDVAFEKLTDLPDSEIASRLTALRGVGQWTAQWVLIRGIGRPDALPLGDLALRRVVSRLFFGGGETTDAQVRELARRWSPYRTFATVYLFTALRERMV